MKITLIYFIFCLILLYIYWHYARLHHLERLKVTKAAEDFYKKENDNYLLIKNLEEKIIVNKPIIKKEVIKKTTKKKK